MMRIMTEKEFDTIQALQALKTGCHMLKELCDEVRHDIPDNLQDSFIQLKQVLDDMRNPIYQKRAESPRGFSPWVRRATLLHNKLFLKQESNCSIYI